MNNLKPLVNDKPLWDSFLQELDNRLEDIHRAMEQTDSTNSLYRLQGQTIAIRKLKQLREYVNA
jgi:hypothetical protein|tara:strand:- start:481 stop:672 length:192 start_codon:yes stop_codon:yes gene_type:complete